MNKIYNNKKSIAHAQFDSNCNTLPRVCITSNNIKTHRKYTQFTNTTHSICPASSFGHPFIVIILSRKKNSISKNLPFLFFCFAPFRFIYTFYFFLLLFVLHYTLSLHALPHFSFLVRLKCQPFSRLSLLLRLIKIYSRQMPNLKFTLFVSLFVSSFTFKYSFSPFFWSVDIFGAIGSTTRMRNLKCIFV